MNHFIILLLPGFCPEFDSPFSKDEGLEAWVALQEI